MTDHTRIVKVQISNGHDEYETFEMVADSDPFTTSLISTEGTTSISELVCSTQGVTNVIGGELFQHYVLKPGDYVRVLERIGRNDSWSGINEPKISGA